MPELPEVEVIRRQLEPLLVGRTVVGAWARASPRFAAAEGTVGLTIGEVRRRGKYLLLRGRRQTEPTDQPATQSATQSATLVIHLGMTGSLAVADAGRQAGRAATHHRAPAPDAERGDNPYLRAAWHLAASSDSPCASRTLTYSDVRQFGRIATVTGDDFSSIPTLAQMGPEPLEATFTAEAFWRNTRRSAQRIKTQLLSQRPVAGVGNIYADEALHRARINPAVRRITRAQAARLLSELRAVLAASIERGGTTLRDYASLTGSGDNQRHLICYGRAGEGCTTCGTELRRRVFDGRSTVLCPSCQSR